MVHVAERATISKFKIGDLALRSAYELERARSRMVFDRTPIDELGVALRKSSGPMSSNDAVAYMRPGYFEPLESVYRSRKEQQPESLELVQAFIREAIEKLAEVSSGTSDISEELVEFCLELHRAFIRRVPARGRHERTQRNVPIEAFVG